MTTAATKMPQSLSDLDPALQARCLTIAQARGVGIDPVMSRDDGRPVSDMDWAPVAVIYEQHPLGRSAEQWAAARAGIGSGWTREYAAYNWSQVETALVQSGVAVAVIAAQ